MKISQLLGLFLLAIFLPWNGVCENVPPASPTSNKGASHELDGRTFIGEGYETSNAVEIDGSTFSVVLKFKGGRIFPIIGGEIPDGSIYSLVSENGSLVFEAHHVGQEMPNVSNWTGKVTPDGLISAECDYVPAESYPSELHFKGKDVFPAATEIGRSLNSQGMQAYRKGNLEEARILFVNATQVDPSNALAFRNLASIYARFSSNEHMAVDYLRKAYVLDPQGTRRKANSDPDYKSVRSGGEFRAFLNEIGK